LLPRIFRLIDIDSSDVLVTYGDAFEGIHQNTLCDAFHFVESLSKNKRSYIGAI